MRIGFDVSQTGRLKAGCGYFADSLIRHLAEIDAENEYLLYPTFGDFYWDPDWPTGICGINRPNFRCWHGHKSLEEARQLWSEPTEDLEAQMGNVQVLHSNNFFCPTTLRNTRLIYTLYDLGFVEHPEWTTEENRIGCFTGVFNASLYADYIVAISEYSRQNFLQTFPHYPSDRIIVVYPASRFTGISSLDRPEEITDLQPGRYWLSVCTLEPRKNQRRLVKAYARLKAELSQTLPLVLAGGQGWMMEDFKDFINGLGLGENVILLGYVNETTLQWLYQNCFAFLYPSLFEGFGLPVLEAMSLGALVICSNATSLPEIVDEAGVLVNPEEDPFLEAMVKLFKGEICRTDLKAKALKRANDFSWAAAAQKVLEIYREAISKGVSA